MQHLDEGTIHAWIDGALSVAEAREVESHLATCEACAQLAAEARGLVAASSRILTALDNVPAHVIPATGKTAAPAAEPALRRWRVPMPMRIAATLLIVAGASALVVGKLNSPERRQTILSEAPLAVSMDSSAGPQTAPMEAATESDLASLPPAVPEGNAVSAKSAGMAQPKPGRPGSRTESNQKKLASTELARTADEAEQRAAMSRGAVRVSDAAQRSKEEGKDVVVTGAGTLQLRDSGARRNDVIAMAAPGPKGPEQQSRPTSALDKLAEPITQKAEQSRLRTGVGGLGSARVAAPSVAAAPAPPAAANAMISGAHPAVGCYSLLVSPWSGGIIPFGAPPARIELDSLTSVQESTRGYNLVHPARGTASNGAPYAYWKADGDSVYITWRDSQRGVTLTLPAGRELVQGTARTFSTSPSYAAQSTQVEARRISCRE